MTASDDTSYLWKAPASYAANEHILAWWGAPQDEVLARLIAEYAWLYPWHLSDAIVAITPETSSPLGERTIPSASSTPGTTS